MLQYCFWIFHVEGFFWNDRSRDFWNEYIEKRFLMLAENIVQEILNFSGKDKKIQCKKFLNFNRASG